MAHSDCRVHRRGAGAVAVRSAIALHRLIVRCAPVGLLLLLACLLDFGGVELKSAALHESGRRPIGQRPRVGRHETQSCGSIPMRKALHRQEQIQMITSAIGKPILNAPPMIIANAESRFPSARTVLPAMTLLHEPPRASPAAQG